MNEDQNKLFAAAVRYDHLSGLIRKFLVIAPSKSDACERIRAHVSQLHFMTGSALVKCEEVSGIVEVSTERHTAQLCHSDMVVTVKRRLPRLTDGKIERGQVAVEAALIGTLFLLLALAFLQVAIAFANKAALDWAARQAATIEAQGQDPSPFIAANAPAGTTITGTACGGGVGTVQLSVSTIEFIPAVPEFPSTLTSSASAVAGGTACL
jgi:hypothetical protein